MAGVARRMRSPNRRADHRLGGRFRRAEFMIKAIRPRNPKVAQIPTDIFSEAKGLALSDRVAEPDRPPE
jgi:hypothetical protein